MSFDTDFDSGLGNYQILGSIGDPDTGAWVGSTGNTTPGSVQLFWSNDFPTVDDGQLVNLVDFYSIQSGDRLWFNYQVTGFNFDTGDMIAITLWQLPTALSINVPASSAGTWQQFSFVVDGELSYVDQMNVTLAPSGNDQINPYSMYIDSIRIGPTPPPFNPEPGGAVKRLWAYKYQNGLWTSRGIST